MISSTDMAIDQQEKEYNEFNNWLYNQPKVDIRKIRQLLTLALDMKLADTPLLEAALEILEELK